MLLAGTPSVNRRNLSRIEKLEFAEPPDEELKSLSDEELVALMFEPKTERYERVLAVLSDGSLDELVALIDDPQATVGEFACLLRNRPE